MVIELINQNGGERVCFLIVWMEEDVVLVCEGRLWVGWGCEVVGGVFFEVGFGLSNWLHRLL